jgi:hypothetical protein
MSMVKGTGEGDIFEKGVHLLVSTSAAVFFVHEWDFQTARTTYKCEYTRVLEIFTQNSIASTASWMQKYQ